MDKIVAEAVPESRRTLTRLRALGGHIPPGQFARYLVVGAWNTLFGYACYAALVALFTPRVAHGYILASVVSSFFSITVAYLGYKFFVFKTRGNYVREWLKCVVVYGSGIIPGIVLLPIFVYALGHLRGLERSAPYVAGAILTAGTTLYNFLGHKHFSFRRS